MKLFLLKFALIAIVSFGVMNLPSVHNNVVVEFTQLLVTIVGWLLQGFGAEVTMQGNVLWIPGFAVEVRGICNGLEATLVLWAALLAYSTTWRYKLIGLLVGVLAVQGLNILRIISLLYLGAFDRNWFEFAHTYLWELLIMLDILIFFIVWLRFLPRPINYEAAR